MVNLIVKLKEWTEDFLEGSDEFLVEVEHRSGSSKYCVVVDGIEPITIKRCGMISRYISKQLDESGEEEDMDYFIFEVASPGAESPLRMLKQYTKHIGRQLAVETLDDQKLTGKLIAIEGDKINLDVLVSKKETKCEQIEFKNIKTASIIISFN